jgi:hypothetical protein
MPKQAGLRSRQWRHPISHGGVLDFVVEGELPA